MAGTYLYGTLVEITKRLSSLGFDEFQLVCGVKNEHARLNETARVIEAVLLDAEIRQRQAGKLESNWLRKLQDVVEDIKDVADDFEIEVKRRRVEKQTIKKVSRFISQPVFQWNMAHKIKDVGRRLEAISLDKAQFNFAIRENTYVTLMATKRETHSHLGKLEVVGRENEREKIVQELVGGASNNAISIIPILGMGGLGKTTLARLVYNDRRVENKFNLRKWVFVSKDFDLEKIIKAILIDQYHSSFNETLENLQQQLQKMLGGKKFLLVLDDIWITNRGQWEEFRNLLVGEGGSKIIITTESEHVVTTIVGWGRIQRLHYLSDEDSWDLFHRWAKYVDGSKWEDQETRRKILDKCKGLPIALKTLGIAFSTRKFEQWPSLLHQDIWTLDENEYDIRPVLRFSFDQLPKHIKQCFAYSAFYSDQLLTKEKVTQLWMAQGFIHSEVVGAECFDELRDRCFFQDLKVNDHSQVIEFKMHDQIHELGMSVLGATKKDVGGEYIIESARHVFVDSTFLSSAPTFPKDLFRLVKLRTCIWQCGNFETTNRLTDIIITNFKYLRVLDLFLPLFKDLPRSIKTLKHLRYLDLGHNSKIRRLPNSICKLYNLQTLRLEHVDELEVLPEKIRKLISLRHLYITSLQKSFPEKGIGCLTTLRTLSITRCRHLVCLPDAIRYLNALEDLIFWTCPKLSFADSDLQGLSNLRRLSFTYLPGLQQIPRGLQDCTWTLKCLCIVHCVNLSMLPEWLQRFDSLERFVIEKCPKLRYLPQGMSRLAVLKELRIEGCPELVRRCRQGRGEDWPKIAHVPNVFLS